VKIDSLPQQPLHWLLFAMQPVNQRSCIAVKEISEFVLLSLNDSQDFATQFQSAQRLRCKLALLRRF
jgi:hypothetical protein